jgi:hypothetical protein
MGNTRRRSSVFSLGLALFGVLSVVGAPAALAFHADIIVNYGCNPAGGPQLQVTANSWSLNPADFGNHDYVGIQMRRQKSDGTWTGWVHEIGNGKFLPGARSFVVNFDENSVMADFKTPSGDPETLGSMAGETVQIRLHLKDMLPNDPGGHGWYNDSGVYNLTATSGNSNPLSYFPPPPDPTDPDGPPAGFVIPTGCVPIPPGSTADNYGLQDPTTGIWRLRNSVGAVTQFYFGNPGDVPFMGDWDCDGVDTPGLYRQSDGYAYLRNSNSQGVADIKFFFGNPGDLPVAGDFDNNGCDSLSIYRPSEQRFYVINRLGSNDGGLGAADYSFLFGNPGDKPVVGDWDGDGIDEIGLHRESSGFFYYRNTLTTGVADGQFYFGDPGDRFAAGDWGVVDNRDTPAVFRPSDLTLYFRHSLTQGVADAVFTWTGSTSSWNPVAGAFGLG